MKDLVLFPLGTRCSGGIVIKDYLNMREHAYPFDWIDIEMYHLFEMISIHESDVEVFCKEYFSGVDKKTKRHTASGTWFPHDFPETEPIEDKYVRRFKRMNELFKSGAPILFLTIIPFVKSSNINSYRAIINIIRDKVKGECHFVSVNLDDDNYRTGNHTNFRVVLGDDWKEFHLKIKQLLLTYLNNHEQLNQYKHLWEK